MVIFFREITALLPFLILCIAILLVLLSIILHRSHFITFCITTFGIILSFISLFLVWNNGIQKVIDLICIDGFSMLCMVLVLIASFVSSVMSYMCFSYNYWKGNRDEFYLLLLIITVGALVTINADHVVMVFFGIELMTLPLFGLMNYFSDRRYSLEATIKYFLLSGISMSFLLFGIALIYFETGQLSFCDISFELVQTNFFKQSQLFMAGIAMILVGFGFKLSLVPFHLWAADVYQGIPEVAGMCLSTINKISVFSVLVRFFLLFPGSYVQVSYILILMSCFSILFGNLMAIKQNNIKRILAYSSISHMGYLLVGVVGSMQDCDTFPYIWNLLTNGIEVIGVYLVNYLFATLGIFSVLSILFCFYYSDQEDIGVLKLYRGLFWRDPVLSIVFTIMLLSLAGIPIVLGFITKFYLIVLSIQKELWWCTGIIILGTVMGILYYLRIITILYLSSSSKKNYQRNDVVLRKGAKDITKNIFEKNYYINTKWTGTVPGIIVLSFSFLLLFFGIYPQYLIDLFYLIQTRF